MKHFYSLVALTVLVVGCSPAETDLVVVTDQTTAAAVVDVSATIPQVASPSATDPLTAQPQASTPASAPLEHNAEKRAELAEQTEKVYLKWNAALGEYRKKHNRLPKTLPELQQFHPVLASLQPPRGFALTLDPQAGEIFVVHARSARSSAGHAANSLPPPLAIP